jgi:SAM-dependent methyltransferase
MKKVPALDAFGALTELHLSPTVQAGRYAFQAEAERRVLLDLLPKLRPEAHHRYLDIGCGAGMLLFPLSYLVSEAVGVDHPSIMAELERRRPNDRITLVGGRFPETLLPGRFDRITAYSVLPCLPNMQTVISFSIAAAGLLSPAGRLVLGDIPNRDRQARFRASEAGAGFEREWGERKAQLEVDPEAAAVAEQLRLADQLGGLTDREMCDLLLGLRGAGYEAYLAEQAPDLPFGRTREDVVVVAP